MKSLSEDPFFLSSTANPSRIQKTKVEVTLIDLGKFCQSHLNQLSLLSESFHRLLHIFLLLEDLDARFITLLDLFLHLCDLFDLGLEGLKKLKTVFEYFTLVHAFDDRFEQVKNGAHLLLEIALFEFVLDVSKLERERVEGALVGDHLHSEGLGDLLCKEGERLGHMLSVGVTLRTLSAEEGLVHCADLGKRLLMRFAEHPVWDLGYLIHLFNYM